MKGRFSNYTPQKIAFFMEGVCQVQKLRNFVVATVYVLSTRGRFRLIMYLSNPVFQEAGILWSGENSKIYCCIHRFFFYQFGPFFISTDKVKLIKIRTDMSKTDILEILLICLKLINSEN